MTNFKKIAAVILCISLLSVSTFANDLESESTQTKSFYNSFSGVIKETKDGANGFKTIFVENAKGDQANFVITDSTYLVDGTNIEVGEKLIGFYETDKMMIMIYPPQYSMDIIAPVTDGKYIKADKFNEELISADKTLKLNISDETQIVWENETQVNWFAKPTPSDIAAVLTNRKLIVFYDFMTKSIPAQTTPTKIIVLSKQEGETPSNTIDDGIFVNDRKIDAPSVYLSEDGVVMVPLRAVAEALGFVVTWNEEHQNVKIGKEISLTIGEDNYIDDSNASVKLGVTPKLNEGNTFVPLNFFKDVVKINNTFVNAGKIIINNIEI